MAEEQATKKVKTEKDQAAEKNSAKAEKDDKAEKADKEAAAKGKEEQKHDKSAVSLDADESKGDDTVKLISQEKTEFQVKRKAAMQSNLVKTALEDDKEAKEVNLVHINAAIVKKVIEYMNYHIDVEPRKIESPLKSTNMKELVDQFDAKFVDDIDQDTLFKLLLAANYMDVKSLLGLICAKVASMMKGKTADQIRKTFNIRGEFTPEEEEEIRKDFKDLLVE